jgi:transposase
MLLGVPRPDVCRLYHRSDRLVRLWIEMFNCGGIDALASKPRRGRPPKVKLQRLRDLLIPVLEDPSRAGELHWTGVKLHGWLKRKLVMELGYRTVIRYLHQLDFHLRVPRPWPERQDEAARAAFLEGLRPLQANPGVELWFADFLAKTPHALLKRLVAGLTAFLDDPDMVAAQCAFRK